VADDAKISTTKIAGFSYFGIGAVLGMIVGVLSFIGAYIYCIATYGFLLGLGLGWLPSIIFAAMVGGATVFIWAPTLLIGLLLVGGMLLATWGNFVVFALFGGAVGWIIWRFAPKSLSGR
jgi:hypothetical protein